MGLQVERDSNRRHQAVARHVVGSLEEFKTEAAAQQTVDALRLKINAQTPRQQLQASASRLLCSITESTRCPTFSKGQPHPNAAEEERKSYATQVTYEGYLKSGFFPAGTHIALAT